MHSGRKTTGKDAGGCAGKRHGSAVHAQGFSTGRGKQTILMSFSNVMNVMLMHRVGGI